MTAIAPRPPLPIRAINNIGRGFNAIGFKATRLDAAALIAEAQRKSGLRDYGPGPFEVALERLIEALETEAQLTTLGRQLARGEILKGLRIQLEIQDWFNRHADIADEKIEAPIIIIGMPRTGTTILHELMQLDPDSRLPLTWEVGEPCPPPRTQTYATDPRIRAEAKRLRFSHYLMPAVVNMHRMGERLPQECVAFTGYAFHSMLWSTIYRIPSYQHWLSHEADLAPVYAFHRRFLQLLQWRCPARRWVLKSPGHLWHLGPMLQEYPDARLVQTHRDPLKIVSSLASMIPTLRSMASDALDARAAAQEWAHNNNEALQASVEFRRAGLIRPERVVDIQFGEFMADQAGAVEKLYRSFDLPFSAELAARIRRYIADNPHDKHGGHKHRFEDCGLDYAAERERCRDYQAYFGVASEF